MITKKRCQRAQGKQGKINLDKIEGGKTIEKDN